MHAAAGFWPKGIEVVVAGRPGRGARRAGRAGRGAHAEALSHWRLCRRPAA
jgi:hypothetical protein